MGEGDLATPEFIAKPLMEALRGGETFYTWQRGIPPLREALARYHARHFGREFVPEEFIVTVGGMHAIQLSLAAIAGAGDEIVYFTPAWPNVPAAFGVAGGRPVPVPLDYSDNGWSLDIERLESAVSPSTRAIAVNSPANPTGWTADPETLAAILALARRHGLWIIADEIYALYHYDGGRAPSFLDIAEPEDRIIYVNSFSKNWAMTGWRMGWMTVAPQLQQMFENLIQYSTTGVASFMQRGGVAALDQGDAFIAEQVARARQGRDLAAGILRDTGRVRYGLPRGAFYLFFSVDGVSDSHAAAIDMLDTANVGVAPGTAFGPGGEAFFRLCFHRRLDQLAEGVNRIADWIRKN